MTLKKIELNSSGCGSSDSGCGSSDSGCGSSDSGCGSSSFGSSHSAYGSFGDACGSYVLQEAAANLAQVWLLLVELPLQVFQESLLEAVDVLDVPKDGTQLLLREHVRPLPALLDVPLKHEMDWSRIRTD